MAFFPSSFESNNEVASSKEIKQNPAKEVVAKKETMEHAKQVS